MDHSSRDLVLTTHAGENIALSALVGKVVVIAFVSKAACHTGRAFEILCEIEAEVGTGRMTCLGCVVDLDRGEELREYYPFTVTVGSVARRRVADFLGVPMSGFALPQFLLIDHLGRQRLIISQPRGETFWEHVDNFRIPVEKLIGEMPSLAPVLTSEGSP